GCARRPKRSDRTAACSGPICQSSACGLASVRSSTPTTTSSPISPVAPARRYSARPPGVGTASARSGPRATNGSMSSKPQQEQFGRAGNRVGRLVSVNVGLPKDVPWQGRTVFTGVFKDPVAGPRRVAKLNVEGDGQGDLGGHGGEQRAVFVYQLDSYRHWERELERDDLVYG